MIKSLNEIANEIHRAVIYEGEDVYCVGCLPDNYNCNKVHPIMVGEEWDTYPVCCECGRKHDYVCLPDAYLDLQYEADDETDEDYNFSDSYGYDETDSFDFVCISMGEMDEN